MLKKILLSLPITLSCIAASGPDIMHDDNPASATSSLQRAHELSAPT